MALIQNYLKDVAQNAKSKLKSIKLLYENAMPDYILYLKGNCALMDGPCPKKWS